MKKLYTLLIVTFCTLFSNENYGQINRNQGNFLPLIESDDVWPFEFPSGAVRDMIVHNDTLYFCGLFGEFNGNDLNGIFKWDGSHIHLMNSDFNFGNLSSLNANGVHSIGIFQGKIVIGLQEIGQASRVYTFNGSTWDQLGEPLGNFYINDIITWNGNLFLATQSEQTLRKLNALNQWEVVTVPFSGKINDLEVYDDKLYLNAVEANIGNVWVNDGSGFQQLFSDLPAFDAHVITIDEGELYALGTFNDGTTQGSIIDLSTGLPFFSVSGANQSTNGFFTYEGMQYFVRTGSLLRNSIVDIDLRQFNVYNRSVTHMSESDVNPVKYKGKVYLAGSVVNYGDIDLERGCVGMFQPREFVTISNGAQFFSKADLLGLTSLGNNNLMLEEFGLLFGHEGLNASPLFQSGFNIAAKVGEEVRVNVHHMNLEDNNWFPGPYTENYFPQSYEKYNRVWKVSREEIDQHINLWNQNGYQIPNSILEWPGNGSYENGESLMLAPFYDVNQNNYYEPHLGDYPIISGKEAMFWVLHGKPTPSFPNPILVDLHVMAYLEEDQGINDNALFFRTVVINRSTEVYDSLRMGVFSDFDLGFSVDDYIGCDSLLSTAYAYNGDDFDDPGLGSPGYLTEVPSFGVVFLSEGMETNSYWNTGMNPINGSPQIIQDYYNYMNGRFKNGSQELVMWQSTLTGPMMYQDSPCGLGTENEIDFENVPSNRRILSAGKVHSLQPNESVCFDFAYYFKPNAGDNIETLCAFLEDIPAIHSFYQDKNYSCAYVNNIEEENPNTGLSVFPNPCNNFVNLDLSNIGSDQQVHLRIIDSQGRVVRTELINRTNQLISLDTSELSVGAYSIVLNTDTIQFTQLLVKQ